MSNEIALNGQRQISNEARLIRGGFRLASLLAGSALRATGSAVDVGRQIVQAAMDGESNQEIAERAGSAIRSLARNTLGVTDASVREIVSYVPSGLGSSPTQPMQAITARATSDQLRMRGEALLAQSADVYSSDDLHPAFDRILEELAPDEARILRYLAMNGPQPCVDVRTNRPLGIGSETIASNLSMVPEKAGCRRPERAKSYLVNLVRLGLVWVSDEPTELSLYMVVEVQPNVADAMKKAGRVPKIARKSMRLSAFGEDFCETCFPVEKHS
ncbi:MULTISPECIES: Abi-alpha family protein [Antrihabitans]|uniref:DUF4393 domain-containing protein n=2 Tax=Antrihabitans TaxID=2799491 RepID=A0A934NS65_9NOCA|nr:Abi-alpha family protein [Antrihabitans stalagmiti]MBJ8340498.1 DUF4393 domain-containing protein [Antrihabitans stalagmiti]